MTVAKVETLRKRRKNDAQFRRREGDIDYPLGKGQRTDGTGGIVI